MKASIGFATRSPFFGRGMRGGLARLRTLRAQLEQDYPDLIFLQHYDQRSHRFRAGDVAKCLGRVSADLPIRVVKGCE